MDEQWQKEYDYARSRGLTVLEAEAFADGMVQ